jgi:murein DD-endopeptidase MepM/ murein hydrolase activator NlpD
MPVSEYPSRRALREAAIKKKRGRNATVVTAGVAVAVSSAAVTFGGNAASDGQLFAFGQTAESEAAEPALKATPRQTSVIPAPITGGDERVVAKMTDEIAASQVGLGRLYQEGEGDVAAGQLAVAEAQNPDNGSLKKLPGNIQLIYPADSTRTSSTFGMRSNPTGAGSQFHVGTDFPVSTGTPVKATASGTVVFAGVHSTGGNRVEIDHGHGVVTAYSHNSQFSVSVGDTVEQGQTVALAGSTGNSTGPHIHYEIKIDGKWVDPEYYLPSQSNKEVNTASSAE